MEHYSCMSLLVLIERNQALLIPVSLCKCPVSKLTFFVSVLVILLPAMKKLTQTNWQINPRSVNPASWHAVAVDGIHQQLIGLFLFTLLYILIEWFQIVQVTQAIKKISIYHLCEKAINVGK